MKDKIQVGDQLIGVDDDYFPYYFPTRDLVQFIKNKRSNPVRTLTFQRYTTVDDDYFRFVRVIPTAEEQIPCRIKNCSKDAAVSLLGIQSKSRRQLGSLRGLSSH